MQGFCADRGEKALCGAVIGCGDDDHGADGGGAELIEFDDQRAEAIM